MHACFNCLDLLPSPEIVTVSISSTGLTALLTFTWSPVTSCLVHYHIHATNCGMCSSTNTSLTTVTCEVSNLTPEEEQCTLVLQIMINGGNTSEATSPFIIMLRGLWYSSIATYIISTNYFSSRYSAG
jgi:hypothetical protein